MSKAQLRLKTMRDDNKLSESDYQLLSAALEKRSTFLGVEFLINPFQKITGLHALFIGLMILIGMSFLGVIGKMYFPGILDCLYATNIAHPKHKLSFLILFQQNIINWLALSTLFIVLAVLFRQKNIRLIDFFGMVALSRFPYLMLIGFYAVLYLIDPGSFNIKPADDIKISIIGTMSNIVWQLCYMWQLIT